MQGSGCTSHDTLDGLEELAEHLLVDLGGDLRPGPAKAAALWTMTARRVLPTDSKTVSMSRGRRVRRPSTSASIPSSARSSAACGDWPSLDTRTASDACTRAFGVEPGLGVITYVSGGTDDDARGVLQRFGIGGHIHREFLDGNDEVVTVTIAQSDVRRVPESRLHTALEAALNCDVRIVLAG